MKRFTRGRIAVNLFTALLAALVLIPLLMVFSRSVASKSAILSGSVGILPLLLLKRRPVFMWSMRCCLMITRREWSLS